MARQMDKGDRSGAVSEWNANEEIISRPDLSGEQKSMSIRRFVWAVDASTAFLISCKDETKGAGCNIILLS